MGRDMGALSGSREPSPNGLGPPGFDPARIAERLTAQQRRDLLASDDRVWWSADGRVSNAMHRKGLIEAPTWSGCALFTPLGKSVRREAIATETRRAETTGSVEDEGAGPKDIAQKGSANV